MRKTLQLLCLLVAAVGVIAAQPLGDDAAGLIREGRACLRAGKPETAKLAFKTLIAVYPESKLVEQAKDGIREAEQAEPRPQVVRSIVFRNFKGVRVSEILQRLDEREAKLRVEAPFDPGDVEQARAILAEFLAERGHSHADIRAGTRALAPRGVEVAFTLR